MVWSAQPRFPLRILITSRNVPDMAQITRPLSTSLVSFEIPADNSRRDIEFYIHSRIINLKADVDKDELARNMLGRSNASFLWVREFLMKDIAGYFRITSSEAHLRIASTCLKQLCSNDMRPPRGRRFVGQARQEDPSPLLDYALTQFSEHVYAASSNDSLLIAVDRFSKANVLTWVERIAAKGALHGLIRTTKNLKAYLERRAKYHSPLNREAMSIGAWSVDLSRLVTRFGAALLQSPSSKHFLIPPLCPGDSAIHTQFGKKPDGLTVVGFKSRAWDDCIATVGFGEQRPMAVSCGSNLIAVGIFSGEVSFYNHQSCQKEGGVHSRFPVEHVHFTQRRIAVCTIMSISLHDLQGNTLWEQTLRFRCILLTSLGDGLYAVTQHGQLLKWSLSTGELESDQIFEFHNHGEETSYNRLQARLPMIVSLSPDI